MSTFLALLTNGKTLFIIICFAVLLGILAFTAIHFANLQAKLQQQLVAKEGQIEMLTRQVNACNTATDSFKQQSENALLVAQQKQKELDNYRAQKFAEITKTVYVAKDVTCETAIDAMTNAAKRFGS